MLGYIFEVIKDEISYRRERARRAALPPPTPETQSPPATPSLGMRILSPPARPAVSTAPLKNWRHPFGDRGNPLQQLTQLANAQAGYYPLGRNGMWHGGVHFDSGTTGTDALSQVHCLADGEVVAYRVPGHTPLSTFYPEAGGTLKAPFATGFVLVRHHLQAPKMDGSGEAPPGLTFYSLYMHLEDWARYEAAPKVPRPSFWPYNPVLRVKPDAPDRMPGHPEQRGANVRHKDREGQVIDFLPVGAPVTISGNGNFRKLENSHGPAFLRTADGSLQGYVKLNSLERLPSGEYCVVTDELSVYPEPSSEEKPLGKLLKGASVTLSGEGEFRKLERVAQYVYFNSLQSERKPRIFDDVVVLDQPAPIKAGELIGHLGPYQECDETAPQQKLHLEVFSDDDVEAFFAASRVWAQRLPDKHKTWLKLAKGTPVSAHQDHISARLLPIWSRDNPGSDADLLVPKSLLDGLPPERKIRVPTGASGKTYNWYRLEGLLYDAAGKPLDGWVREEVGVTPWVSPWSWDGYDVLYNYALPQLSLSYLFSVTGVLGEESKERLRARAEKWDKGRLQTRLYEIIDRDRNGKMTADELQAALRVPALAQSLAQLVILSESEWLYRQSKWDALDEVLGHTNSAPILNWVAEKQRMKQLSWWGEVAGKVGLSKEGMVFHFHPVRLFGGFLSDNYKITVSLVEKVTGKTGLWFTGKGGSRRFAKEFQENYPNIYGFDKHEFIDLLNEAFERHGIVTPYQQAHFVAQCFHESAHFETTIEFATGGGYDPGVHASAIANGNTEVGDGQKYKGKGLIQLTWKNNYKAYSKFKNIDLVSNPNLIAENMYLAVDVSCWFWRKKGAVYKKHEAKGDINILIDKEPLNVSLVTLAVNGGSNGLSERTDIFNALMKEWGLK
jgi:predicted chitinase